MAIETVTAGTALDPRLSAETTQGQDFQQVINATQQIPAPDMNLDDRAALQERLRWGVQVVAADDRKAENIANRAATLMLEKGWSAQRALRQAMPKGVRNGLDSDSMEGLAEYYRQQSHQTLLEEYEKQKAINQIEP
jgi:hypothetical protein